MKKILLISTGGTISCSTSDKGLSPKLTFEELLKRVPNNSLIASIDGIQLMNMDSGNFVPDYWIDIAKQIKDKYDQYDGFIITHGTDTLAYTSSALSYLIQNSSKPIVVTGSQRPIEEIKTDAIVNLSDSISFACKGIGGVFVVFNGKVIHGTQTRKIKTKGDDAFISLNYPYVAEVINNEFVINSEQVKKINENKESVIFFDKLNTNVHVIKMFPGLNTNAFKFMLKDYDAVVIEAYGTGSIPYVFGDAIDEFYSQESDDCYIVVVSQAMFEGTNMKLYEISNKVINIPKVIEGNLMSTEAAVTKLMWALANKEDIIDSINKQIGFDL